MSKAASITVRVRLAIRHRPGKKTILTPMANGLAPVATRADPALRRVLAWSFRYQRRFDQARYASISEMATAVRIKRDYLSILIRLTLLAPNTVETILNGHVPERVRLQCSLGPHPNVWRELCSALTQPC